MKHQTLTLRLDPDSRCQLGELAKRRQRPRHALMVEAIRLYLANSLPEAL